jgi:hypothetical protein
MLGRPLFSLPGQRIRAGDKSLGFRWPGPAGHGAGDQAPAQPVAGTSSARIERLRPSVISTHANISGI